MLDHDHIDWTEEARLFYSSHNKAATAMDIRLMARQMERRYLQTLAEDPENFDD